MKHISKDDLTKMLMIPDLTKHEGHAINLLVKALQSALEQKYGIGAVLVRGEPIVAKTANYDDLGYPNTEVTLSERYTRYVSDELILRTQMTSVMSNVLRNYSKDLKNEQLWLCPGIVYRRDVVDRTHVGEPHQMDVWYLKRGVTTRKDLLELVETVVGVVGKILKTKLEYRINETSHHYTDEGIEVEILYQGRWLEILECGLAGKKLLQNSGINPDEYGGLALGMGLDRLVMIAKGIDDIRILRDPDERIVKQMTNLEKYKVVSKQPMIKRDLSLAINENVLLEEVTEDILNILGVKSALVEEISLITNTKYENLPSIAKERLGISTGQENWLIRIILRHPSRSISTEEANNIYKLIYEKVHQGVGGYLMN